jgi:hypothetical protein
MTFEELGITVYLDMDGLLANLFDFVAHYYYGVENYKNVTAEQKRDKRKIWASKKEFYTQLAKKYDPNITEEDSVRAVFANLPSFGKNGELTTAIIKTVRNVVGPYNICSCPAGVDPTGCEQGKNEWIDTHLQAALPEKRIFTRVKADIATTNGVPNILIDDFPPYIEEWRAKKGEAIEMRTDKFHSAGEIEEFLTKELNLAKQRIEEKIMQKESFEFLYKNYLERFKK